MAGDYSKHKFFLVFVLSYMAAGAAAGVGAASVKGHRGMRVGFYSTSCPLAESIVTSTVQSHLQSDPSVGPAILRMHFHDCFVRGCDASILIDGPDSEKHAAPNLGVRGYEVIDDAKAQLEATCPGVVSCADVLALAARDAVFLAKGPKWDVPTGRRDGRVSLASDADNLPSFADSIEELKRKFAAFDLNNRDLVTLIGAHTIGTTACQFFSYRLFNFTTTRNGADPSINPEFVSRLRTLCPPTGNETRRVALDMDSAGSFDTSFFKNLRKGRGILESDQRLWTDASTRSIVESYLGVRGLRSVKFNVEFGKSMMKMSNIQVKTGTDGISLIVNGPIEILDTEWQDLKGRYQRHRPGLTPENLIKALLSSFVELIRPPLPKICGSPNGPPITAPRIRLKEGRYLAYKEYGVAREVAKYKIIYVHGFESGRHNVVVATSLSPEVIEELGVYIVFFDRPGYGESDPNPKRTVKSMAMDIEELADQVKLGSKFYVIGYSMGGLAVWSCLKHIPQRLAGVALLAPAVTYWWPNFPANVSNEAFNQKSTQDQWVIRVSHYAPWLVYWWNTQKLFPASSVLAGSSDTLSSQDMEIVSRISSRKDSASEQVTQQGEFESLHRDLIVLHGAWEFNPLDLRNPFPNHECFVHLWHGSG
ncbi:hypothetical protein V6N13_017779 [Hibiscus sabdariffa]|uniref:peroxidase n=1 Tax=Hibiscus sabdariffa TaxID=183260 RepID=A0ABR2CHF8_9ROSI